MGTIFNNQLFLWPPRVTHRKHSNNGNRRKKCVTSTMWLLRGRLRLKCDGTRAETRFRLSPKRTSPFKSARGSVRSTVGSRGVRISGINAGYTMFRGSAKSTGYPLHSTSFPFTSLPMRHRLPSHFNWTLLYVCMCVCIYIYVTYRPEYKLHTSKHAYKATLC
jgi:hypothetical protein